MVVVFDKHPIFLYLKFLGWVRDTLSVVSWSHLLQCICISLTPSTKVITLKIHPGSFWVTGVKRSFSLKCRNSSMLQSMTIRLIHVHQLQTLYLGYGVKCQSGVNWGHWGKKGQKLKNATPPTDYRVWSCDSCICISLTPLQKISL